jgi:transcriptional regulator GlxA family with amidase domain
MSRPSAGHTEERPQVFVFLLVPGASMMTLAAALEPLRSLNRLTRRQAYVWRLASLDGAPVTASNGIPLPALACDEALEGADYFFACGGLRIQRANERHYVAVLRQAARRGISVGSLSTGTYLLARAGLLAGYRCTIHWENRSAFQEDFPELNCTNKLYEIDRDRLTCSGGIAAMDMMLHVITERHGRDIARAVANQFHHERIRDERDDQRGGRLEVLAHLPESVREAIVLMQRHVEEPVALSYVAQRVHIGARQLERLFMRHTGLTPLRYYMQLRVERARELLIYSDRRIIDIAVSSGFASTSHFATWYRRIFGTNPSDVRGHDRPPAAPAVLGQS